MKQSQIIILIILASISFLPYFFRSDFVEGDSYYFLNHICKKVEVYSPPSTTPSANFVMDFLPCNFFVLKGLLFVGLIFSVLAIAWTGSLFNKEHGWIAGAFSFLSPILSAEFLKFENDQLGYVFLFWAIYFFYKAKTLRQQKYNLVSLFLIIIGSAFWNGGAYLPIAFALSSWFFIPIAGIILFFFSRGLIWAPLAHSTEIITRTIKGENFPLVLEQTPLVAIKDWFLLWFGVGTLNKTILPQLTFFLAMGILQVKFAVLAIPFLSIGLMNFFAKTIESKKKWANSLAVFLVILCFFLSILWGALIFSYWPNPQVWSAIDYGIQKSKDLNAAFEPHWDLGYLVHWKNQPTQSFGSIQYKDYNSMKNMVILTEDDVNCVELKRFDKLKVFKC